MNQVPFEQSLSYINSSVASEWNYDKNDKLPEEYYSKSGKEVWWKCGKGHEWKARIISRTKLETGCPYCSGLLAITGENDLATVRPDIVSEWNWDRNKPILPSEVKINSFKKVWWKCSKGHEWKAQICSRARNGNGCPFCSNKKIKEGENDLVATNPELVKEWNYEKNTITPHMVTSGTNKKVWWICREGHEWEASIRNRSIGRGCPYCSGRRVISEVNDLATINPNLAKEWDYSKNTGISPKAISIKSNKKVYWKCSNGHSWRSTVASRSAGGGCPICSGRMLVEGINDLATINPRLALELHPSKNGNITSRNIMSGSRISVWWKCSKGHEWKASVYSRTAGKGCPYCSGRKAIKGETDLATLNPQLAKELHPIKNGDITADTLSVNSGKRVWWKCSKGHEWQVNVCSRNKGTGCPYCSGKKVIQGETDLLTLNPGLAKEFSLSKNGFLKAEMLTVCSGKKVWWKCEKGHEWRASVAHRNNGEGCPYCVGKKKT